MNLEAGGLRQRKHESRNGVATRRRRLRIRGPGVLTEKRREERRNAGGNRNKRVAKIVVIGLEMSSYLYFFVRQVLRNELHNINKQPHVEIFLAPHHCGRGR